MKDFSFKVVALVLAGCVGVGLLLDRFTEMHWAPASLLVLLALLINGLVISIEDSPQLQDFNSKMDYLKVKSEYQSVLKHQALIILLAVFAFGASIAYFGN